MAGGVVAVFRIEAARAGAETVVRPLVDELCEQQFSEFAALWPEQHVQLFEGIVKHVHHPQLGLIALEYSAFPIDGRPDVVMVVCNPATMQDRHASLLEPADDQLLWASEATLDHTELKMIGASHRCP